MYCYNCGSELLKEAKFCSYCGKSQSDLKLPKTVETELIIDEKELKTKSNLKYYNGIPFTGKSVEYSEYYDQTLEFVTDDDLIKNKQESNYLEGRLNGLFTVHTENSYGEYSLIEKKVYSNGNLIQHSEFEINGAPINNYIYEDGKLKLNETYLGGKIWLRNTYSGYKITKEEYFTENEQLSSRKTVIPDSVGHEQKIGKFESFNEDGTPRDELFFSDEGEPIGIWKRFNEVGELYLVQEYKDGNLISEEFISNKNPIRFRNS
jgi:hypothetical protein